MLSIALFRSGKQRWLAETSLTFSRRKVTGAQRRSCINQRELGKPRFPVQEKHCPMESSPPLEGWKYIGFVNLPQAVENISGNSVGVYDSPKSLWFGKYGKVGLCQDCFYSSLIPITGMRSTGAALRVPEGILSGRWGAFRWGFSHFFFFFFLLLPHCRCKTWFWQSIIHSL